MAPTNKVIVTGGNGYIGGVLCHSLAKAGFEPISFDNFSTSRKKSVPWKTVKVELTSPDECVGAFSDFKGVVGVFHLAARALVSESFTHAEDYLHNNVLAAINVTASASKVGIPIVVHSSSCAIYGKPTEIPISEKSPTEPISPYGTSKLLAELAMNAVASTHDVKILHLRYFNPAGATDDGLFGEDHAVETHLVPLTVRNILSETPIEIYGRTYSTPDGTCVRDFIHIVDLASAHMVAMDRLIKNKIRSCSAINIGVGGGTSVLQVIQTAESVLKKKAIIQDAPARPGDPPSLVSDNRQMKAMLEWEPKRTLVQMIESQSIWQRKI